MQILKKQARKNVLLLLIILVLQTICVYSASIGVSPGALSFDDMIRGGYSEGVLTVSISAEKDVFVTSSVSGEISDWIILDPPNFTIKLGEKQKPTKVIINPPENVQNGIYNGVIKFKTTGLGDVSAGHAGVVSSAAVDILASVEITDIEIIKCRAFSFSSVSAEENEDAFFSLEVINEGNVLLFPTINIDIWDQEQKDVVKYVNINNISILQSTKESIRIPVNTRDLEIGQYWAEIFVKECPSQNLLTFDVLEEGSLISNGLLTAIKTPVWVDLGENVPIEINFKNTGEKEVLAKFNGKIQRGTKVLNVLKSEELRVSPGAEISFNLFYLAKDIGKHVVSGRVFYDKKRTFESSSVFNVRGEIKSKLWKYITLSIVILLVLYIGWKIRAEKNRLRRKKYY